MGFAASITVVIFLASFIIIASNTYDDFYDSHGRIEDAKRIQHEMWMEQQNTDIDIFQIQKGGNNNLVMTVDNTGSEPLDTTAVTILVDGDYFSSFSTNPTGLWMPGTSATFTLTQTNIANSDHMIRIITENGISDIGAYNT